MEANIISFSNKTKIDFAVCQQFSLENVNKGRLNIRMMSNVVAWKNKTWNLLCDAK